MTERTLSEIPTLETENYFLRGMTNEDVTDLFAFMSNSETMKFITPHPVKSEHELQATIETSLENFREEKEIPWVIIHKQSDEIVGMFRFHKLNLWHKKTEMGVVIRRDFQRRGVMSEILASVLPYGFNTLGLNRIVGDIFAKNKGSEKLLMNYGFKREGTLRQTDFDGTQYHDTVVFSLLKSEFTSRQTSV
ncbi:GNAT family N-acetyltransferase [Alkalihalobacterium chitinilyticum]|uniref:GNAT family N-acetyltransferase n=1 Tax=Alkalihalobacterium chitinilyticum TaxID=2980103 RepID=A0ABT5VLI5_9BACI|nr:GNAT family protein [Alkalihalobacterium chitinilyticum]MDE5416284.1 GNAT family N-acetyltransferase [Alkalihalobacterium chitinilyticum]